MITGANGGLGFQTALALARTGTHVVLACRSTDRGERARSELLAEVPHAEAAVLELDVSEPESIREFARQLAKRVDRVDRLVNNAGVVLVPLARSSVGHESHLATNHLGAFALTGTLLPLLGEARGARIVNVGSLAHRFARLRPDDVRADLLDWETAPYSEWKAYARSKLAVQAFTLELDRRLRAAKSGVVAVGAHPGFANTNAGRDTAALEPGSPFARWFKDHVVEPLIPKAHQAARPIVHAATAEGVRGGDYYGPRGPLEIFGRPGRARTNRAARDAETRRRLWALSEEMTGVHYLSDL